MGNPRERLGAAYGARSNESVREYNFFRYPQERREVFAFSKAIAEYLRTEKVSNLVIIDRSSRPLYIGVMEYLRAKYPSEKMPGIYFMNPKGFKAKEDLTIEELKEIIEDCTWKDDLAEKPRQVKSGRQILNEFKETYKRLLVDKNEPVLVFDTCLHTGNTLTPVKKVLEKSGMADVRIGSVNPADPDSQLQTDFYITKSDPEKGCYPFDRDRMIEKTFNHVYSKKTNDEDQKKNSVELRHEIKDVMTEFLAAERKKLRRAA